MSAPRAEPAADEPAADAAGFPTTVGGWIEWDSLYPGVIPPDKQIIATGCAVLTALESRAAGAAALPSELQPLL